MDGSTLLTVSLLILAFGLVSGRVQDSMITPPMVFVAFGLVVGAPSVAFLPLEAGAGAVQVFAELTLVLVLFTDASRIDLAVLRRDYHLPFRLLAIGMPLSIGLGTGAALLLFPALSLYEAALLAAILAPTDAALGQAVLNDRRVPVRIRQALNVESGLNDGFALPLVLALAACAEADAGHGVTPWVAITIKQLSLGPIVGIVVGRLGGRAVPWSLRTRWMNPRYEQLVGLSLAFLAYAGAEQVGGNGFIAAFVAGLALGGRSRSVRQHLIGFTETEGRLLILITFFLVGAVLVWPIVELWDTRIALYAALSLSIVRMVPVAISIIGTRLLPVTKFFLGWFGPRGLASVLFGVIIVERIEIPHRELIFAAVLATGLASIFAHGLTAAPAARRYGRRLEKSARDREIPEHIPVTDLPVRVSNSMD